MSAQKEETTLAALDLEWVELIQEAMELGLTAEEIRDFLESKSSL